MHTTHYPMLRSLMQVAAKEIAASKLSGGAPAIAEGESSGSGLITDNALGRLRQAGRRRGTAPEEDAGDADGDGDAVDDGGDFFDD